MEWDKLRIKTADDNEVLAQAPIIISASRSTDIPAFYSEWFINRMKEGYLKWKNPFSGAPLYVSFEKTRLVIFWSKNPKPIIEYLPFLDERSVNYYFQFSLNDYENEHLEPNVPPLKQRIETFINLSERIGPDKVIWRFDPLMLTSQIGVNELLRKIEGIADQLQGYTKKMVFSFADIFIYNKVFNNLRKNLIDYKEFDHDSMIQFARELQSMNQKWGFEIGTCAENIDLDKYGICHNHCIDEDLIIKLFYNDKKLMNFLGVSVISPDIFNNFEQVVKTKNNKDKGQRQLCGCMISKDIGEYNTCLHFCEYCYANTSRDLVMKNWRLHKNNSNSETITGK